jgi:hypothetical protein
MQKRKITVLAGALALWSVTANGAIIVSQDPATALFNSSTATPSLGGITEGGVTSGTRANGMTMNVTVTPLAADLTGTVLLMEIGGSTNGTGFYLINGVPTFVSKQSSGSSYDPSPANDSAMSSTDSSITVSTGTPLVAGTTYSLAAIMSFAQVSSGSTTYVCSNVTLGMEAGSGPVSAFSFPITDTDTTAAAPGSINWDGNNTLSYGAADTTNTSTTGGTTYGYRGGLSDDTTGGGVFYDNNSGSFSGTLGQGLFYNSTGSIVGVPEPLSASTVLLTAAALGAGRRRRR